MTQGLLLILCALTLASCVTKQNIHTKDLDFIYYQILENHPGTYNAEDSNFLSNLNNAYASSKAKIDQYKDIKKVQKAITEFVDSFEDTHLQVRWVDGHSRKKTDTTRKFCISALADDIVWVTLPTFQITADQSKDFERLLRDIATLQAKKYIIFDLRGNQGGNSDYGSQVIDALFGAECADHKRCLYNKNVYVDWRASPDNLSHISSLITKFPDNQWLQKIERGLESSLKYGHKLYRESFAKLCTPKPHPNKIMKIIVITDATNVSAALDFIDELRMMPTNIILIGQKTKADRLWVRC